MQKVILIAGIALLAECKQSESSTQLEQVQDSTFADTSKELMEDTALINYSPSSEPFVDEGGESSPTGN
jgi:hypothetical protein